MILLKNIFSLVLVPILFSLTCFAEDLKTPVGKWKTIDDETNKPKSIIEISADEKGVLTGKIIQLFKEPNEEQNPLCDKCEGEDHNKPVIGLKIMWDMTKESDNKWENGKIMDPKKGKTYKCKLTLTDEGKKLQVRGFIGFSLLGRTQTWERQPN